MPLGEAGGRLAWFCLNLAAWVGLVWLSPRVAGPPWAQRYWGPLACALLFSPPTYSCLLYGQLGIMLALLLVAGYALAPRRSDAAGATLALAAVSSSTPGCPRSTTCSVAPGGWSAGPPP